MKLQGTYKFKASQEKVWEVLTNPRHLEKAIPGCEKLEEIEPGKYDATLKIGHTKGWPKWLIPNPRINTA